MTRTKTALSLLLLPTFALTISAAAWRGGGQEIELDEADVFIEFNSTDGDFGIQFFWDGEAWEDMIVRQPGGAAALRTKVAGKALRRQGLTEGFFESAEPSVDDLPMDEFLERFSEGEYTFLGTTLEGDDLVGDAELTHTLPMPPANLWPADDDLVDSSQPVVATFDAVTQDMNGNPLDPEFYEVVVESEDEESILTMLIGGDVANPALTIPPEFLEPGTEYKLEVIVAEESGNKVISETEWETL